MLRANSKFFDIWSCHHNIWIVSIFWHFCLSITKCSRTYEVTREYFRFKNTDKHSEKTLWGPERNCNFLLVLLPRPICFTTGACDWSIFPQHLRSVFVHCFHYLLITGKFSCLLLHSWLLNYFPHLLHNTYPLSGRVKFFESNKLSLTNN